MIRRALLLIAATVGLGISLPGIAAAQDAISVAVLPTDLANLDHADIGEKLRAAMRDAVTEAPEFVESRAIQSTYSETEALAGCVKPDPECLSQLATMMPAVPDRMVWARLERKEGAWFLQVRMLDFEARRFVVDREWTMPGGAERVEQLVTLAGGAVRGSAPEAKPTARLIVDSDPPGADITLDGRPLGTTPVTQTVTRGRHLVELSLPGRRTVRKEIEVGVGEVRELIRLPIVPKAVPPTAVPVEPTVDWPFWVGVGSGALAGVAAVTATVAWVNGQSLADDAADINTLYLEGGSDDATFRAEYDGLRDDYEGMKALHAASVVTAVVAGGAAVYFLVFHETDDAPVVTPAITPDGAGAFITGSF